MIGTHAVTVTAVTGGAAVDISCLVDTLTIHHGRDDTDSQPEASSATVDMSLDTDDPADALPTALDIGATIKVTTTVSGTVYGRFTGRVTDIAEGWNDEGEDTPNAVAVRVIATGPLADMGRRVVGDIPWPLEIDGDRVHRIFTAAGLPWDAATSDPGTVQILPRDVDSQPALDTAQSVAADAGGMVWETRDAQIRYADSNHRRNAISDLTLDSCDILVTPTWSRTTSGLINDVSIGYGVPPAGSEQSRYLASDPVSKGRFGTYAFTTATQLNALADATAMGQLILTRNHLPVWIMSTLPVDVAGLSVADTKTLLGLDMHGLINLTGLPAAGTAPTSAYLWVEGWNETLEWGTHELELVVSGYCRTTPPPRWDDMLPAWTWDAPPIAPSLTWDDASCVGPIPSAGRWDDTPASFRWNQIASSVTWNTWPY